MASKNVKRFMFKIFLIFRYCLDYLIDYVFGYFYRSKKATVKSNGNPILLESGVSLARKIRKRELKSEQVVNAFIERIKEVNALLNAIVDTRFEEALDEARQIDKDIEIGTIQDVDFQTKPFLGVPFTTKESTACKGLSFTLGLKRRKGKKATFDADYVERMKEAGAILLGVTNVPQLNLWQETQNGLYGTTNNPYDTTRNVGGSSGGEASILAACGIPISVGTDIGGSCRIPAFMCGVYGHKPTHHIISTKGMGFRTGKEKQTIVCVGPMTRYVEDIGPMLKVLSAENAHKLKLDHPVDVKNIKIYYVTNPKDPFVSPFRDEMKEALAKVVNHFTEISNTKPTRVNVEGAKYSGKLWKFWMSQESDCNFCVDVVNREGKAKPGLEIVKYFLGLNDEFTLSTIFNFGNTFLPCPKADWAKTQTDNLKKELLDKLGDNGVLLYPSAPWPASYHYTAFLRPWNFHLWSIWNLLKFPATQVPVALNKNGLPLGIQVVAAPYQDRLCLAVAAELERSLGGYVPPFKTDY